MKFVWKIRYRPYRTSDRDSPAHFWLNMSENNRVLSVSNR